MRTEILSPIGNVAVEFSDVGVTAVSIGRTVELTPFESETTAIGTRVRNGLLAYFAGDFSQLNTIPVDLDGTPFQKLVWTETRLIPAGETLSYSELALRIGHPTAYRAVANALNQNPLCLIVPCHRVIGKDGSLVGYAYGLEMKRALLAHEKVTYQEQQAANAC